jgi:hypothetical protein
LNQEYILNKFLNKEEIVKYSHVGGVRIEDNIVVTKDGCELLTVVPRSCNEIEEWMKHNDKNTLEKIDYQLFDELNKKFQHKNQDLAVKKNT